MGSENWADAAPPALPHTAPGPLSPPMFLSCVLLFQPVIEQMKGFL